MLIRELNRPPIIHYVFDDGSGSAAELVEERYNHCMASVAHYRRGDRRSYGLFADIPEIVREESIDNPLLFNPCQVTEPPSTDIGHQNGTSVIRLMDRLALEVAKERQHNPDLQVVATVTLHQAEVVENQPDLDTARDAAIGL